MLLTDITYLDKHTEDVYAIYKVFGIFRYTVVNISAEGVTDMKRYTQLTIFSTILATGAPLVLSGFALAATDGVGQINNFVKNIIQILTGIATLIAVAFIVIGGLHYITSSGNPERLDRAKRTILYASLGLVITIAAFAITNTVGDSATKAFGN